MNFPAMLSLATLLATSAPISEPAPLSVGIIALTHSGKLRVAIDKSEQQHLSVRLTNADGVTLYQDFVGRKELTYRRLLNLEKLPIRCYFLVISNGNQIIRRTLSIERVEPVTVQPTRLISLLN